MKKRIIIILLSILMPLLLQAQPGDLYYYYKGEKIFIQQRKDKLLLKFAPPANKEMLNFFIQRDTSLLLSFDVILSNEYLHYAIVENKNGKDVSLATLELFKAKENVVSVVPMLDNYLHINGITDEFILRLKPTTTMEQLQSLADENHCTILEEIKFINNQYLMSVSKKSHLNALQISNLFYETELFEFSSPNFYALNSFNSFDPYFDEQWGLKNVGQSGGVSGVDINIEQAWSITEGSPYINVALVDAGVDLTHPDLAQNLLPGYTAYYDSPGGGYIYPDKDKHGTACAGIIGAIKDNAKGISGVAPKCKIIPIRMSDITGAITSKLAAQSIRWAWQNGADVISNSWGGLFPNDEISGAIDTATIYGRNGKGCVVVAGAGNGHLWGFTNVHYPGYLDNVIAVGAIDRCGYRAGIIDKVPYTCDPWPSGLYSSYGPGLNVVAPGSNVYTTDLQGSNGYNDASGTAGDYYSGFGGTSGACPHVAGIAALILSIRPDLIQSQVRQIIESSCTKLNNYTFVNDINNPSGTWYKEVGHGLVNAYAALRKSQCRNSSLPLVPNMITQNTILKQPFLALGTIYIKNGTALTITSQVYCEDNTTIIVEPGGKLILDGGTLTNACIGQMWQGVIVQGDSTKPMNVNSQGFIELTDNGKIENAVCGITVHGGGLVATLGAHFINNTHAIKFLPLASGQSGTSGFFQKAKFTVNKNYPGNIEDFKAHINAASSGKLTFHGCTFSSSAPREFCNDNLGIFASNTDIDIGALCPQTNCSYDLGLVNRFSGFNYAVYALNSGSSPALRIRYTEFKSNDNGVYINGISSSSVIRNEFITKDYTWTSSYFAHGVYVANATGYKIEENRFIDSTSQMGPTIGLHIFKGGIPENEVYKNYFTGFTVAQVFEGRNSNVTNAVPRTPTGLQTLCNEFNEMTKDDIHVGAYPVMYNPPIHHSIRIDQGNFSVPAGNLFDKIPQMNINNTNSNYSINYYYGTSRMEEPVKCTNTITIPTTNNRNCPERNGPLPEEEDLGKMRTLASSLVQYDEWNDRYEYWLARWYEVCGEKGRKAEEQKSRKAEEQNAECDFILDMVSYYSALKDNYFNSIISARLGVWLEEKEEMGKESLYEDLRFLFAYRNHYTDNLSIAETYLAEGNFAAASSTLSTIYEKFTLTEEQASELMSLQIYVRWLQQLEEKGETIYKLPENEIEYLVNYVETRSGRGVVFANNILCGLYGICKDNYELRISNYENEMENNNDVVINQSSFAQSELSEFQKALENITLIPNPTTGQLTINSGQLTIESVEIFDIYGKKQLSIVNSQLSIHEINISHLPVGIYFVKIKTDGGEVMKKIVKN